MLIMYVHCHLYTKEIIGIIGGKIQDNSNYISYLKKEISIVKCYPCRTEQTEDQDHNVEMDPVS
jgi:hypothetical protein